MDWIKIMCNTLDHRKIKMIRKGPEGNTLVLFWLLMLIEAGKCNRGGYLMISDTLPYTAETLGMVTDIPLPTVQLGLTTFVSLDMIDQMDGAIFIKNWGKYQSEDRLEARRENDRQRQQRHRQKERDKLIALPEPPPMSRDSHDSVSRDGHDSRSRDVTGENREDNKVNKTKTDDIRQLLSGTPLAKISDRELCGLARQHGINRLRLAADVAAETWRRNPEDKDNPGGYLNTLCTSLEIPDWYKSKASVNKKSIFKIEITGERLAEMEATELDNLWDTLSDEQQDIYRAKAAEGLPKELLPTVAVNAIAKSLARNALQGLKQGK